MQKNIEQILRIIILDENILKVDTLNQEVCDILYQHYNLDKLFFGKFKKAEIDGGIEYLQLSFENVLQDISRILSFEKSGRNYHNSCSR